MLPDIPWIRIRVGWWYSITQWIYRTGSVRDTPSYPHTYSTCNSIAFVWPTRQQGTLAVLLSLFREIKHNKTWRNKRRYVRLLVGQRSGYTEPAFDGILSLPGKEAWINWSIEANVQPTIVRPLFTEIISTTFDYRTHNYSRQLQLCVNEYSRENDQAILVESVLCSVNPYPTNVENRVSS